MRKRDHYRHLNWTYTFHGWKSIQANFNTDHPDFPCHDHDFMELSVVSGGSAIHVTAGGEERIQKGDAFLFRPGAWHAYRATKNFDVYNCCFGADLLGHELAWMVDIPHLNSLLWRLPMDRDHGGIIHMQVAATRWKRCRRLLDELCALSEADPIKEASDHVGILTQILGLVALDIPKEKKPLRAVVAHPAARAALKLIDNDPSQHWTIESLAAHNHLKPEYFIRVFRALAGVPPIAYRNQRRFELATTLLVGTELNVGEIGSKVGWDDASYFSRTFHAKFNMSPSDYRRQFGSRIRESTGKLD